MNIRHLAEFCWADRDFFDDPARISDDEHFDDPTGLDRTRWTRTTEGAWTVLRPVGVELPDQGWKIHVAATLDNATKVLDTVWRYCTDRRVTMKFLRSPRMLLVLNEKNRHRATSGKFITIYTRDDDELTEVLTDLGCSLSPFDGPYILSDLRHGDGPLHVRYGAFRKLWCFDERGVRVHAVRRPDGRLIPDKRSPVFAVPDWVRLPDILAADLEARHRDVGQNFPYTIERAIQFSNGGGTYRATDAHGDTVLVREARPHSGLDRDGADAVARLRREHRALVRLAGLPFVPALVDHRVVGGHHFLIEEYVEGVTLLRAILTRYPLADPGATGTDLREYLVWVEDVLAEVERAVRAIHERGVGTGDLHPGNVLIRPDNSVVIVDFELASDADDSDRPALATPGFTGPAGSTRRERDLHALERMRFTALLPLTGLPDRDPSKLSTLVGVISDELRVPTATAERLRRAFPDTRGGPPDRAADLFADARGRWPDIRAAMVTAILDSSTPERDDRLFPGDPAQFRTGGLDLAHGAAGVLYALHRTGVSIPAEHVDWLVTHASRLDTPPGGLYRGLHGVALTLDRLGRRDEARDIVDRVADRERRASGMDLFGGQAGIALALLDLFHRTGDPDLLTRAQRIAYRLGGALDGAGDLRLPDRAGLLHGLTGVAALFLRLYDTDGDTGHLDRADVCLRRDLARCTTRPSGALYLVDGFRHLPYLDSGSLGLAVMLARYARHRPDPAISDVVAAARFACDTPFCFQPGLQTGRAGLVLGLTDLCRTGLDRPADRDAADRHVRRLGWSAVNRRDAITFPGAQLLRLSHDLVTGSAGVLLAVHAAVELDGTFLPALDGDMTDPPEKDEEVNHDQPPGPSGPSGGRGA